jgi:pimeloyl-ACP methyl ester carboxylesterase
VTIVMVHGNPETAAVWGPLLTELGRDDVVCLSPPGFGAAAPQEWAATVESYRGWLVAELESVGEPVHLVGHDWGGGHALTVAMTRPDLLHSWCSDLIGCFEPGYVWHRMAQVWQTSGAGEDAVAAMIADPSERLADMIGRGLTREVGEEMARGYDATMARCILALYRDAAQPSMAELGRGLPAAAARPGLAVIATEDANVGTEEMRERAAARSGATAARLDGLGHWWMVQDPARGAAVLTDFWASLPAR